MLATSVNGLLDTMASRQLEARRASESAAVAQAAAAAEKIADEARSRAERAEAAAEAQREREEVASLAQREREEAAARAQQERVQRIKDTLVAQRRATDQTGATLAAATAHLVEIAERRSAPRMAVALAVRAVRPNADGAGRPFEAMTTNISTSGALLKRCPQLDGGPWRIQVYLPDDSDPVRCEAELARTTPTHFGIAFQQISAADERRIGSLIERDRRVQARQPQQVIDDSLEVDLFELA